MEVAGKLGGSGLDAETRRRGERRGAQRRTRAGAERGGSGGTGCFASEDGFPENWGYDGVVVQGDRRHGAVDRPQKTMACPTGLPERISVARCSVHADTNC